MNEKEPALWESLNSNAFASAWIAVFKFADTGFRFVSWLIILALLRGFLKAYPQLVWLWTLYETLNILFVSIIVLTTFHLVFLRIPGYEVRATLPIFLKILLCIVAAVTMALSTSPHMELDYFIDELALQKPVVTHQNSPAMQH